MDFPEPKIPLTSNEETVVGVHSSGIQLEEGASTGNRAYCANCKRNIHCHVVVDKKTKEAEVKMTCKMQECECRCRTHYACKNCGYLHPYGQKCNRIETEPIRNSKNDEEWDKLLEDWRTKK